MEVKMRTDLDFSREGILSRIKSTCKIENGCWLWGGSTTTVGRPFCSVKGKNGLAYRHSYEAFYDKTLSSDVYLCHSCDNKLCCNPEHLFEGDNQLNQLDYIAKNGEIKNGFNSGDSYVNTGIKRKPINTCPNNLIGLDRLLWYKNNAVIVDNNDCWIWQREIGRDGYGRVRYKNRKHAAHRLLWGLYHDKVDQLDNIRAKGLVFRHLCNNKRCCNPAHITPGTRNENALDSAIRKFDEPIEEWLELYSIVLVENSKLSRLSVARGLRSLGLVSDFVSDRYVVDVLRGKFYKHIHREFFDWTPDW
jgi:hypothetical protein